MKRLYILRPMPAAETSAERARALGLEVVIAPLFGIEPLPWHVPDEPFDALLLTSANAVRFGGPDLASLTHLPVHAVGEETARAASSVGFTVRSTGQGGVDSLLSLIEPGTRLLHLCGAHRRQPSENGPSVTAVAAYRSAALPAPDSLNGLAGQVAAVHSPRAAERLAELIDAQARPTISLATISPAAAQAAGPGWRQAEAATDPSDTAVLALAARLCDSAA